MPRPSREEEERTADDVAAWWTAAGGEPDELSTSYVGDRWYRIARADGLELVVWQSEIDEARGAEGASAMIEKLREFRDRDR